MPTTWIIPPAPYDHDKSLAENRLRHRGTLRCSCGAEVTLATPNLAGSDTDCTSCDAVFNLAGQELRPRREWEEDPYGDD
jgi:hypothetical protein